MPPIAMACPAQPLQVKRLCNDYSVLGTRATLSVFLDSVVTLMGCEDRRLPHDKECAPFAL